VLVDPACRAKEFLRAAVVVEATSLIASADEVIQCRAHVVRDLVAKPDQEQQVLLGLVVERALGCGKTLPEIPVLVRTIGSPIVTTAAARPAVVSDTPPRSSGSARAAGTSKPGSLGE
jgi:hypothetical protein